MTNFTPDMIEKAKQARNPEELLTLAEENGVDLTAEEAEAYYAQLNPRTGELDDDELDAVSGGGCHKDNRLVVTAFKLCGRWRCKDCYESYNRNRSGSGAVVLNSMEEYNSETWMHTCISAAGGGTKMANCTNCEWCVYEGGLWLCNDPARYN